MCVIIGRKKETAMMENENKDKTIHMTLISNNPCNNAKVRDFPFRFRENKFGN